MHVYSQDDFDSLFFFNCKKIDFENILYKKYLSETKFKTYI